MKLQKETLDILKSFSAINTNVVIPVGKKISTISPSKDILAEYEGEDKFDTKVSIFNLNELLGVLNGFGAPDINLDAKSLTIKEGKQKATYLYADESLLSTPTKSITMPAAEVKFELASTALAQLVKMAGVLTVEDVAVVGDGKNIVARIYDAKIPGGNSFEIDLDVKTKDTFTAHFKIDKFLKLFGGDYDVEISSKKISKFSHKTIKLVVYLAVEADSQF